ncbi:MAG: hypothetical protein RL189_798 [Pseudomonadota bacterium]|jgi:hypothetical protein
MNGHAIAAYSLISILFIPALVSCKKFFWQSEQIDQSGEVKNEFPVQQTPSADPVNCDVIVLGGTTAAYAQPLQLRTT